MEWTTSSAEAVLSLWVVHEEEELYSVLCTFLQLLTELRAYSKWNSDGHNYYDSADFCPSMGQSSSSVHSETVRH